ncbi:MAG: metalloregulator ArsR/SmtB family transcription factor [Saprospiraceae bacterium]
MLPPEPSLALSHDKLRRSSNIFRALAHPLRMRMVSIIWNQDSICVNEIFEALGIEQSLASQHLRILRQAQLVTTKRQGKFIYYAVDQDKMLAVSRALTHLEALVEA